MIVCFLSVMWQMAPNFPFPKSWINTAFTACLSEFFCNMSTPQMRLNSPEIPNVFYPVLLRNQGQKRRTKAGLKASMLMKVVQHGPKNLINHVSVHLNEWHRHAIRARGLLTIQLFQSPITSFGKRLSANNSTVANPISMDQISRYEISFLSLISWFSTWGALVILQMKWVLWFPSSSHKALDFSPTSLLPF